MGLPLGSRCMCIACARKQTGWCFVKMKRCFAVMCGLGILRIWLRNVLKMARALWASCAMRTGRHGVQCGKQGAKCWNVCLMNRSARSRRGSRLYCMTENTLPEAGLFFRIKVTEHKEILLKWNKNVEMRLRRTGLYGILNTGELEGFGTSASCFGMKRTV